MDRPSRTVARISEPDPESRVHHTEDSSADAARDADASPARYFHGLFEVPEKNEAESRLLALLAQLSHMARLGVVGQMFAALAHELNQPLTAINNFVGTARHMLDGSREASAPRVREMIDHATTQTQRAGAIVHALRAFTEKRDSARLVESIDAIIRESVTLAFAGMPPSDVEVKLDLMPDPPLLVIDRIQIQQVLVNLIRNAMEAMLIVSRRELTIATRRKKRYLCFSVCDTGPGLTAEAQARLFTPFVTTKKSGMGVGLAICKTIVEAHGGRICLDSTPNEGTRFSVYLPVAGEVKP